MGPRFFKRGELGERRACETYRRASMGPRFFKRGEVVVGVSGEQFVVGLQWGHAFSSVESWRLSPCRRP